MGQGNYILEPNKQLLQALNVNVIYVSNTHTIEQDRAENFLSGKILSIETQLGREYEKSNNSKLSKALSTYEAPNRN